MNLQPLGWCIKGLEAKGSLRLRESELWKPADYGHSKILEEFKKKGEKSICRLLSQTTDYMVSKNSFEQDVCIPSKQNWDENSVTTDQEISVFTDASITRKGTGIGIFSEKLHIQ